MSYTDYLRDNERARQGIKPKIHNGIEMRRPPTPPEEDLTKIKPIVTEKDKP